MSYDLTGDGTFERVETFRYFATDPVPGHEEYRGSRAGLQSATGTLGDMSRGTIRVEVWNAIGNGTASLGVGSGSVLTVPFQAVRRGGRGAPSCAFRHRRRFHPPHPELPGRRRASSPSYGRRGAAGTEPIIP
ncbi:hypothetical protein [Streptomyces albogriseolus]|uniref:hypothetical protein n=1 Tax=Streptomyces albogriseolus TaxID=1887 RepID=UPI0037A0FDE5